MRIQKKGLLSLGVAALIGFSCTQTPQKGVGMIKKEDMDLTVNPGDDFYRYSNGAWLKNTPIPDDKSRYGAFDMLAEKSRDAVSEILSELMKKESLKEGSNEQKIRDYYKSSMDTISLNKLGVTPIMAELAKIDAIKNNADLLNSIVNLHKMGVSCFFSAGVGQDLKDATKQRMWLGESGISLPDRDYYLLDDESNKNIRKEYLSYITDMFILLGETKVEAIKLAQTILSVETKLAKVTNTRLENRNYPAMYNPTTLEDFSKNYTNFNFGKYFTDLGANISDFVILSHPKFIAEFDLMLKELPLSDIKTYLKWQLFDGVSNYLSLNFGQRSFDFYSTVLSGTKVMEARQKRMTKGTSAVLGEAVGELYVKKYFSAESKVRMENLVQNLRVALRSKIEKLDWMSAETKIEAIAKLDAFRVKIGYPDKWKDYSAFVVTPDSYIGNIWNASKFAVQNNLDKLGQEVDKEEWGMTPQTVNAYYHPLLNEIVFPAAILQPPFFYSDGDEAINYGAIGVVIGHEMSHGFDDQGRTFDKHGNMKDWWTDEDSEKFIARANKLVEQFNDFTITDGTHVNGKLTLGENIADLGGLTISLEAYNNAIKGKTIEPIDGFTNYQRFFLAYAKVWRANIRAKSLKRLVKEDVHSPGEFRVNGGLFNIPEFYQAFDIKKTDKLYRNDIQRAKIW